MAGVRRWDQKALTEPRSEGEANLRLPESGRLSLMLDEGTQLFLCTSQPPRPRDRAMSVAGQTQYNESQDATEGIMRRRVAERGAGYEVPRPSSVRRLKMAATYALHRRSIAVLSSSKNSWRAHGNSSHTPAKHSHVHNPVNTGPSQATRRANV